MSELTENLIGQILLEKDYLTQTQLDRVLEEQAKYGMDLKLGSIILGRGLVTPEQLYEAVGLQLQDQRKKAIN